MIPSNRKISLNDWYCIKRPLIDRTLTQWLIEKYDKYRASAGAAPQLTFEGLLNEISKQGEDFDDFLYSVLHGTHVLYRLEFGGVIGVPPEVHDWFTQYQHNHDWLETFLDYIENNPIQETKP